MGDLTTDKAQATRGATHVETILKDELERGDRALHGVAPVLSHLLASSGHSLVSDAVVARLRGMLSDLSRQLIVAGQSDSTSHPVDAREQDALADHLASDSVVLSHCYALAMEGHLTERFEQRASIDPVLTPLMQELIASDQPLIAELAMSAMAAQSRFIQSQRRMDMPLAELPAELFHSVLKRWEGIGRGVGKGPTDAAISTLKQTYDEGASRVGLLARLISAMQQGARAALDLDHAGLALFASALSTFARYRRELGVLACHENQMGRFALSLRAAGLDVAAIERQFLLIEPAQRLPLGLSEISVERASTLLGHTNARAAG